jgi:hypothetical protein
MKSKSKHRDWHWTSISAIFIASFFYASSNSTYIWRSLYMTPWFIMLTFKFFLWARIQLMRLRYCLYEILNHNSIIYSSITICKYNWIDFLGESFDWTNSRWAFFVDGIFESKFLYIYELTTSGSSCEKCNYIGPLERNRTCDSGAAL